MKKKIMLIGIISLSIIASLQVATAIKLPNVEIEEITQNHEFESNKGKWFLVGFIAGTTDEQYLYKDGFALSGNASDVIIFARGRIYRIGDNYEGSDFFGVKMCFRGKFGGDSVFGIATGLYVEAL